MRSHTTSGQFVLGDRSYKLVFACSYVGDRIDDVCTLSSTVTQLSPFFSLQK